jgi:hypothetical protein
VFLTLILTANCVSAQAENPMIGDWRCSTRETARDATRIVGVFRGTATLRLHADLTFTGATVVEGTRPGLDLAGRWSGNTKQVVLQLADGTMRGSLVKTKLSLWFPTTSNREASVSTSWTCTKPAEPQP